MEDQTKVENQAPEEDQTPLKDQTPEEDQPTVEDQIPSPLLDYLRSSLADPDQTLARPLLAGVLALWGTLVGVALWSVMVMYD